MAVAAGGAIGSAARYLTMIAAGHALGSGFAWGTLVVNVAGSLAMGLLVGLGAHLWQPSPELKLFLTVGVLGGFTTFSTFSLDVALMIERGEWMAAALYVSASVLLSVGGLFLGLWTMRQMVG